MFRPSPGKSLRLVARLQCAEGQVLCGLQGAHCDDLQEALQMACEET